MGNTVGNQVLFPAPEPCYDTDHMGLIWDTHTRTKELRPFLYIPYSLNEPDRRVPTIVYLHANACDVGGMDRELRDISRFCGVHVLAVEYPGYGVFNNGDEKLTTSPEGINAAAEHAVELLISQGVHPHEIIFFGRSIGTGPATLLARLFVTRGWTPCGLILQSPYVSIHRIVSEYFRLGTWLVDNHWDNKTSIEKLSESLPILIIHGELDEIIPVAHGKELYSSSPSRRKHLVCPRIASHNEWDIMQDIIKPVRDFVKRYGNIRDQSSI
jgi:abhydrolase domain-containing protein 17